MSEVSADELDSGQLYSGEKLNGFPVTEQQESQQTTGAQAIIENLLRKLSLGECPLGYLQM